MSDVAYDKKATIVEKFIGKEDFDDRVDRDTEITSREALHLLWRCLQLLIQVRRLFVAKIGLQLGMVFIGLFLPWISKIVIDQVLLSKPFSESTTPWPPFMHPIVNFLDGRDPLEIMFILCMGYLLGLILFGMRAGGTGVWLLSGNTALGQDETAQAENKISWGGSSAGGIWGVIEYWVSVRMSQRLAHTIREKLFQRLSRLPMTTLSDQRTGDSIYRVLYDTASIPLACYDMTLALGFSILGAAINIYL